MHCSVNPLFSSEDGNACFVELPLVHKPVTGYYLLVYPHKDYIGNWLQLTPHKWDGYNKRDGALDKCREHNINPKVCEQGLTYQLRKRSLIRGTASDVPHCRIWFTKPAKTIIQAMDVNKYVATIWDNAVESGWQGKKTQHIDDFTIPGCKVSVKGTIGWILESVNVHNEKVTIPELMINLTAAQLPKILTVEPITPSTLHQLHLKHLLWKVLTLF